MNPRNKNYREVLINASEVKVMPDIAKQVVDLISKENTSAEKLQRTLMKDPALCSKILNIANSAFYGLQKEVKSISMAIVILGFRTLKSLVISAATKSIYTNPGVVEEKLWEHAVCSGISLRIISKRYGFYNADEAFILGLFHDIGKTIINNCLSKEYKSVFMKAVENKLDFCKIESDHFQINHTELGSMIIKKWGLDESIAKAIENHHNFVFIEDEEIKKMIDLINISNYISARLGAGFFEKEEDEKNLSKYFKNSSLTIPPEDLDNLVIEIEQIFEQEKRVLN